MLALKWLDAIRRKNLLATSSKIIQENLYVGGYEGIKRLNPNFQESLMWFIVFN